MIQTIGTLADVSSAFQNNENINVKPALLYVKLLNPIFEKINL